MAREENDGVRQLEQTPQTRVQNKRLTARVPGDMQIGAADVTDQQRVAAEHQPRLLAATAPVGDRARQLSGVPVNDVIELAPDRYRMSLQCADADACRAAMARIAADKTFARSVDAEGRVQIPAKPSREVSR